MQVINKKRLHLFAMVLGMLFAASVFYEFIQPVHQQEVYELAETAIADFEDPEFPVPAHLEQLPYFIYLAIFSALTAGIACHTGSLPPSFVPNLRVQRFISFHQLQIAH